MLVLQVVVFQITQFQQMHLKKTEMPEQVVQHPLVCNRRFIWRRAKFVG